MHSQFYDIVIIGAGLSGLQMLIQIKEHYDFFKHKKIAIIDKSKKTENDRTWSFWEEGFSRWDLIAQKTWDKAEFHNKKSYTFNLDPYRYKSIEARYFYEYALRYLDQFPGIHLIHDEVLNVQPKVNQVEIHFKSEEKIECTYCFDSRPDLQKLENTNEIYLKQHFKGAFVLFREDIFDIETANLMDFRLSYKDLCSFTYVLPITKRKALVEFTLFSKDLIEDASYDEHIKIYIEKYISKRPYKIFKTEQGVIPMTTYDFQQDHKLGHFKIGTSGGWVKASTGYAFKNSEKKAAKVIQNLKENKDPMDGVYSKRYQIMDQLFLDVLSYRNDKAAALFEELYSKNSIQQIFKFLDEESTIQEDIAIMSSFKPAKFLRAILRQKLGI